MRFGLGFGLDRRVAGPSGSGDSRWADVRMLVDFTGADGQTTVTDYKSGNVFTLYGGAAIVDGQVLLGAGKYALSPDSDAHDIGLAPDTIELLNVSFGTLAPEYQSIFSNYAAGSNATCSVQYIGDQAGSDQRSILFNTGAGGSYLFAWTPTPGQNYHLAFTRDSSANLRFFVDGTQVGSTYANATQNIAGSPGQFVLGGFWAGGGAVQPFVNGRLGALRVTDGEARYVSNFTPPTSFPRE